MTAELQQLIEQSLPRPGVAAWVVRLPDQSVSYEAFTDWFSESQLTQILAQLIQAAEVLPRHQIQPDTLCWVFDHARVYWAGRMDGACLAVFVENRPNAPTTEIRELLRNFLSLPAC